MSVQPNESKSKDKSDQEKISLPDVFIKPKVSRIAKNFDETY